MDIFWETGRISQIPEHSETQWRVDYPSIWDCLYGMAYICHTRLNERTNSTEPSTWFGWTEDTKGYLWVNLHELIRTNLYKQKSTNCILHPMSLISCRTKTNCNLESWLKTCRSLHLFSYFCISESHEKWGITKNYFSVFHRWIDLCGTFFKIVDSNEWQLALWYFVNRFSR